MNYAIVMGALISCSLYGANSVLYEYERLMNMQPSEETHLSLMQLLRSSVKRKPDDGQALKNYEKNIVTLLAFYPLTYGTIKNVHVSVDDKMRLQNDPLSLNHYIRMIDQIADCACGLAQQGEYKAAISLLIPISPDMNHYIVQLLIEQVQEAPLPNRLDLLDSAHELLKELTDEMNQLGVSNELFEQGCEELSLVREQMRAVSKKHKGISFESEILESEIYQQAVYGDIPPSFAVVREQNDLLALTSDTIDQKLDFVRFCIQLYAITGKQETYTYAFDLYTTVSDWVSRNGDQGMKDVLDQLAQDLNIA